MKEAFMDRNQPLSLRNYFAGQITTGAGCMLPTGNDDQARKDAAIIARVSFILADAMVAASGEQRQPPAPESVVGDDDVVDEPTKLEERHIPYGDGFDPIAKGM